MSRSLSLVLVPLLLIATNTFAAGRELAPRGAAPTSYQVRDARVGFAGERFLTVWIEDMSRIGTHLMGAFSDASGRRVTPIAFPIANSFRGRALQLVGTGDSYALFWRDADNRVYLSDIDLTGRMTRTTELALPPFIDLHVAWNGTRFFAAVRHPVLATYSAEGLLLSRSGEILKRDLPIDDFAYAFHAIADGDGFAAATSGFEGVFAYRITGNGDVTEYAIDETRSATAYVSTATDGALLVTWPTNEELRATVVSASGTVQPHQVLASTPQPTHLLHVRRVNDKHLITYIKIVENTYSGIATITRNADGTFTLPNSVAGRFSASVLTPVIAASSAQVSFGVFAQPSPYPAPLMSVAIANDATASEPEFVSVSRTRQAQPILGSNGANLLAAWSDIQGSAAYVRTSPLSAEGSPLSDHIAAPAFVATRELPSNGSEFLVVQSRDDKLLATRVAHDGTPIDAEPIVLGEHTQAWWTLDAAVAWAGDRWIVAWERFDRMQLAIVRNGVVTTSSLWVGDKTATKPVLGFNGSTLLLVWNELVLQQCWFPICPDGTRRTVAARLTPDGVFLDLEPLEIPFTWSATSIATSGEEFLVLGETTATIIDASAAPRILESRRIFNWPATGDVTWDGSSYAVALRYLGARWHLSVTHLDRDLNVVGAPVGTPTLAPDLFLAPSIARSLVVVQEGDPAGGARAVVYSEAEMLPLPAPPPAPLGVRATPIGNGRFEITWGESIGAELYRVTVTTPGGSTLFVADVPADQPRRVIAPFATPRVTAFNAGGASDTLPRRRGARW